MRLPWDRMTRRDSDEAGWPQDVPWSEDMVERALLDMPDGSASREMQSVLTATGDLGPRVTLAVIWLSKGSAAVLREMISAARLDWRDVLLWAEYDWSAYQATLAERGGFSQAELSSGESLIRAAMQLPRVQKLDPSYTTWVRQLAAATQAGASHGRPQSR